MIGWTNYRLALSLEALHEKMDRIMSAMDDLKAAVTRQTTVDASAVTLIQGLATQLQSASNDPAIQDLVKQLTAATQPLANAITANTTAAPAPSSAAPAPAAPAPSSAAPAPAAPAPSSAAPAAPQTQSPPNSPSGS